MLTTKSLIKVIFNSVVGVILIYIWSRFVNISEIFSTISKVNILWLIPVFLCMFLSPLLRALRLQYFLSPYKKVSLRDLFFLNGAALMFNFFIPIRIGEVLKGGYLNTKYGIHLGKAVIWIFLDRFVDFLMVLFIAGGLLIIIPTSVSINFIIVINSILITALLLTYIAIFQVGFAIKLVSIIKNLLIFKSLKDKFENMAHFILDSFSILKREKKELGMLAIITFLAYGADAAIWYFTFIALGFPQDLLKMYLGQMLSALTYLVPAAPGYVGSAEASGLLILSGVFGINNNLASAMTVLFHILSAVFVIGFGLISVFNLKLDVTALLKKALNRG